MSDVRETISKGCKTPRVGDTRLPMFMARKYADDVQAHSIQNGIELVSGRRKGMLQKWCLNKWFRAAQKGMR